jgi:propanediol dehydratase large subunit
VLGMQRQRIAADYLQTSAIIAPDGTVEAAVNDPNEYAGPGTGYRLEGDRWARLRSLPHELDPRVVVEALDDVTPPLLLEGAEAEPGSSGREVVVAVGPAYGDGLRRTINGLRHEEVLAAVVAGVREGGAEPRLVRVRRSSDVAFIAHDGARLSGSGVGVGLQSKGTAVIHRSDLEPLDNLELFGMAPLLTVDSYRSIGRNAAGYAMGEPVGPVPTELDNFARAKLIVATTLLHARETAAIVPNAPAVDVALA